MSTSALIAALKPFAELPTLPGFSRSAYLLDHTLIHTAHKAIAEATAPVPESDARQQARAQVESIVALVAALNCDYDRLEELREERSDWLLSEGRIDVCKLGASDADTSSAQRAYEIEGQHLREALAELTERARDYLAESRT